MNQLVTYSDSSDDDSASQQDKVSSVPEKFKVLPRADDAKENIHQGRIRSFEHERGNWAAYVSVPVPHIEEFGELGETLRDILITSSAQGHPFYTIDNPHISLTRTLKLRHHWLADLTRSLEEMVSLYKCFYISLRDVNIYTNDEETRTFISIKVMSGDDHLLSMVHRLNSVLSQYNLPPFYQEASFHVSLCWCIHNAKGSITAALRAQLENAVDEWIRDNPECSFFKVNKLTWKAGNKESWLPLANG